MKQIQVKFVSFIYRPWMDNISYIRRHRSVMEVLSNVKQFVSATASIHGLNH